MKKTLLTSFLSIIFFSFIFIGQTFANDNNSSKKNVGNFTSVSQNGNVKDIQGTSTAIVLSTDKGQNVAFQDPYGTDVKNFWAGTINATVDGNAVKFYCIDINHHWATGNSNPYTDEGPTSDEITYVLNHYYPYNTFSYAGALSSEIKEASAVQVAIWHYADELDVSTIQNVEIKNRVNEIIADVTANVNTAVYPDYFTITPASLDLVEGTVPSFVISAIGTDGQPYSGLQIDLTTTEGSLSANQVTTDANGEATFTLTQNGGSDAIVTASADAVIAHGTQYFHIASPETKQKMVLATPTIASAQATAEVSWYEATDCDLHNYTTFTQGGWGGPSNSTPGGIRDAGFNDAFPNGIVIGGTYTMTLTSADAVKNFIPSGSTAGSFNQNYVNPTSNTSAGVFAGQLVAATMNVYYHDAGYLGSNTAPLGGLVFVDGPFEGMTLYDFLDLANEAIGGNTNTGYSYSEFNDAATKINENFDDGTVNMNYLTCSTTPPLPKGSIGDKVWYDTNENGIQDASEAGVPNVVVKLYSCDNTELFTTNTDVNGNYIFNNLPAGEYYVQFILPSGHVFTTINQGNDDTVDSDADANGKTICTTLNADENNLTLDAGIYQAKAGLGDFVWQDLNNNGIQDINEVGISGVTVKLYSCQNVLLGTTNTDENGYYLFSDLDAGDYYVQFILPAGSTFSPKNQGNDDLKDSDADVNTGKTECTTLVPGETNRSVDAGIYTCLNKIGDFVWHDKNVDGIQDSNEPGIPNVLIDLYSNGAVIASTNTNSTGYYEFNGLEKGTYTVKVKDVNFEAGGVLDNTSASEKWYVTYANIGNDDAVDSDGDANNSATVSINCNDDLTVDFGFFHTCMTFSKSGPQSVVAGEIINYSFTATNCGDIVLHGGVSIYDPMLNPNGNHKLANFVLEPGTSRTIYRSYTTTDAQCGTTIVNDAWAIGHPKMPDGSSKENIRFDDSHSVEVTCVDKATLGDRVWYDDNFDGIQDFGEDGIKDVTVELYDCNDQFVKTTTTDDDGYYLFDELNDGGYYVKFILPNDYLFTTQNATGSTADTDSDADETTGKTTCTSLVAGQVDLSWDAGMYIQPTNDFDLSITKTASNTNPDDEEMVTYTLTVTNNSSVDGTNVTVSDLLPAGLVYQSSSPAGYDTTTGVWNIGNVNAGDSKSLEITVKIDYLSLGEQPIFNLGVAARYNLFVLKDAVQPSSDTEGRVAVGRNATFGNYSVGDKLSPSGGTDDVLVVGRKLTYTSGQVYNGNVVYGKYKNISQINLCSDGSIRKDSVVDFNQATVELNSLSSFLATKQATGTTTFEWGGLHLSGSEPILNVFEIDGNDLSAANSMQIDVPNGSVVLVNVNRRNVSWTGGLVVNGTAIGNVLYNFHKARNLYIQGIDVRGSILAPKAKVNFAAGVINGQMICKYFEGQGQMNNAPFNGSIYGNPEITNCAEITSFDQVDVDLTNNSACADLVVNVDYNPNNGNDDPESGQWVEFAGTGLSEMIWSMYHSSNGLLVGTVGGNIYRNNGTDFELLNESMNVVYIWSLYEYNGDIFAGTEQGLYRYDGSDWTKVDITGDVRSITSLNNVLYAAVWGGGVFSSSDNGVTWVAINDGLAMSGYAVQTLTVANGNLFVGTFGLGVLRYDFDNNTWVELPVGFPFIWMLATDADNNMYASTSGSGVYVSTDNGDTWDQINNGLNNMHIYAVSVYGSDVYVSTWSGGVYKFVAQVLPKAENGSPSVQSSGVVGSWSSLGMGGIEVSSIMVDETTQTLYAGTSTGTIYKKLDGVTDVNPVSEVPTKFGLEQNYPNPFNPSTKIEFSIAEAGLYAVKVFNVLGQEVATVANQDFSAGKYTFNFDASNLTSGIYFYKLVGENVNLTKKMMLLK